VVVANCITSDNDASGAGTRTADTMQGCHRLNVGATRSADRCGVVVSHGDDVDEAFEGLEVVRVARVQREAFRARDRSDQQINGSRASRPAEMTAA